MYALDANQARLQHLIDSPFTLDPDPLALHPKPARLVPVHAAATLGKGPTRLTIYPIRGHGDERMMMVYLPGPHVLYGSSNDVNLRQKPQPRATFNAFELVRRVEALKLPVREYVAIHTDPLPWRAFRKIVMTQPAISSR